MVLVIDEIVNVSPTNTVLIGGAIQDWINMAADIQQQGALNYFSSLRIASTGAIMPFPNPGIPGTPASFSRLENMAGGQIFWNTTVSGAYPDSNSAGYALFAPTRGPYDITLLNEINLIIIPETGNIVAVSYAIQLFSGMGPGPGWPADDSGTNNFQYPPGNPSPDDTFNAVLIITTAIVPDNASVNDMENFMQGNSGMPNGWSIQAVRSVVLPDTSPLAASDSYYGPRYPASPVVVFGLCVADVPYLRFRGSYDFTQAEKVYAFTQNQRNGNAFFSIMKEFVSTFLTVAGFFAPNPGTSIALYLFQSSLDDIPSGPTNKEESISPKAKKTNKKSATKKKTAKKTISREASAVKQVSKNVILKKISPNK